MSELPSQSPPADAGLPRLEEPLVLSQTDLAEPQVFRFASGRVCLFTAGAPGHEGPNEDSVGLIPVGDDAGVLVVADGAGGMPAGEDASRLAIEELARAVLEGGGDGEESLRTAILDGFERANRAVLANGSGGMTTLAVAEIRGRKMRAYHVGDSMVLVTGQRGRLKLQTVAHSPVGYAVEAGMLDEQEAVHHADRHMVSNMVGDREMRIEVGHGVRLAQRDTLVVGSDGLFDNLYLSEVVEGARKGRLRRAVQRLCLLSRERMQAPAEGRPSHPDDLSCVVFRLDAEPRGGAAAKQGEEAKK